MTKKNKRVLLVAVGDKQAGHAGALLNPEAQLPVIELDKETGDRIVTGYEYPHLSPMQKQLWKWHDHDRKEIGKLAGRDPIVYLGKGDETQGGYYKDDLADVSLATQHLYSYHNMLPWMEMPQVKAAYFEQGTSVHLWGAGDTETILTHRLRAEYPRTRVEMCQHWELDINGLIVDTAHHGPGPGIREWTKGNILRLYTRSLMQKLHDNGKRVPDLVLRAHYHQPISEIVTLNLDLEILRTEAWITPPLCVIGAHGVKATQSVSQMHVGMLAFEIVNGKLIETHYKPFWHTFDLRVRERVSI